MERPLTLEERLHLARLLIACEMVGNKANLERLIKDWQAATSKIYNGAVTDKALTDVVNLIEFCGQHEGGLEKFIGALAFYEQESAAFGAVVAYLERVVPGFTVEYPTNLPTVNAAWRNNPLRQTYLRQLVEQIGTLTLAQINPNQPATCPLEEVYVDSPTPLALSVEVKDWQVLEWWLSRSDQAEREEPFLREKASGEYARPKPEEMGYTSAPFEVLVKAIEGEITEYRKANLNAKADAWGNKWNNGVKNNVRRLHLNHLAAASARLVILGAPGSGKSTFVLYLALCLAGEGLDWQRVARLANLENWTSGVLTPIYIELRRFVASSHFPVDINQPATARHLWDYISQELLTGEVSKYASDLKADLEAGLGLIILDGLDEVPYQEGQLGRRREQLKSLARDLNIHYTKSRIIVTSRPYAYEGWSLPGFTDVIISAFEDSHQLELATKLYRAVGEKAAEDKAEKFNERLEGISAELKDRPLFVTLMATLFVKNGDLPLRRGALYRESIMLLLERWTRSKKGAPSLLDILGDKTAEDLLLRLAALAYDLHGTYGEQSNTAEIDEGVLYKYLKPLGGVRAAQLIPYLCENAGVLVSPGQNEEKDIFHFAHRTFQEYLAAVELVRRCHEADSFGALVEHIVNKPQIWRVPATLAGDVLTDEGRKAELWDLLAELLDGAVPKIGNDPNWWRVWLAAVLMREQELDNQPNLNRARQRTRQDLIEQLVALVETPQALPPPERAECGRLLSLLGDPRFKFKTMLAEDGWEIEVPIIEWWEIEKPEDGKFVMGADDQSDNPRREVKLEYDFKMAKYPITYRQYACFVKSDEYNNPKWWRGFPAEYQAQELYEQEYQYDNHPRESVSWYQAVAFGRWLTAKYQALGELVEGQEIRLPTEEEWEYAARGTGERTYPYGNEYDATKGNTVDANIGMTSAVGMFPDGASPFKVGVQDMSGNVWEWCLNKYNSPADTAVDDSTDVRVLRGGSFSRSSLNAAASFRLYLNPNYFYDYNGFRVVVSSPMAPSGPASH